MKKYNHAMTLAFEVASDDAEQPTIGEILFGLARRIASLKSTQNAEQNWLAATEDSFDVADFESEGEYERWVSNVKIPADIMTVFSSPN